MYFILKLFDLYSVNFFVSPSPQILNLLIGNFFLFLKSLQTHLPNVLLTNR